jgi:hypothetical protein
LTTPAFGREFVEIISKKNSERKGKVPKALFKKAPDDFYVGTRRELQKRSLTSDTCGPVTTTGSDPVAEANTMAVALIGNSDVSVVPNSAVIKQWPGYALINEWASGHAFASLFPDGDSNANNLIKSIEVFPIAFSENFTDDRFRCCAGAVVLSSGSGSEGNCKVNDADSFTVAMGSAGDADLNTLIPGYTTRDASVLEFDFVSAIDGQLTFDYLFASEEYNEYVQSSFNDVFGFFINGENVAMIGSTVVSINSINLGSNSGLYVNNDPSDLGTPTPFNTQYDGFTQVLTTKPYQVTAGQTYHIKLAIADAGDSALDSTVYIKSQSLAVCPSGLVFCDGSCVACCPVSFSEKFFGCKCRAAAHN